MIKGNNYFKASHYAEIMQNKIILITGATSGIGMKMAQKLWDIAAKYVNLE